MTSFDLLIKHAKFVNHDAESPTPVDIGIKDGVITEIGIGLDEGRAKKGC